MWSYESLWKKAKQYIDQAQEVEDRNSYLFPLFSVLSLEILARSVLASVHSCLLADSSNNNDVNILFACGITGTKPPKSISSSLVFRRCIRIIDQFTENDYKFCMSLMEMRNIELHTGSTSFENRKSSEWLPEFYRNCKIFLDYIDKDLKSFLGKREAIVAKKMISALLDNKKDEAFKIIKYHKDLFNELPIEERLEKINRSKSIRDAKYKSIKRGIDIKCPACEGAAKIYGELISSSIPRDNDGELVQESSYLPKRLQCFSCDLHIEGYTLLHGIDLGDPFQKYDVLDPVDYYDIDPYQYIEDDFVDWEDR